MTCFLEQVRKCLTGNTWWSPESDWGPTASGR